MTLKRRFPLRQFHASPPVYRLRVHGVPVVPSSHRLGAFASRPPPGVHGLPVRRLRGPLRLSPEASSCREALPPHDVPPALGLRSGASRVPPGRRKQHPGGGVCIALPRPLWAVSQAVDRGEDRWTSGPVALPEGRTFGRTRSARVGLQARRAAL
jgi:hypothetical protein